jgi:hypothetical protein
MKHPSNRELFEYWNRRRGRRRVPERSEIEPGAIRHVLADTFVLAFEAHAGHPFRIAGTRVCALFGRELKGVAFLDLWEAPSSDTMRDLLAIVTNESVSVVASARGADSGQAVRDLELLMLPLSHRGRMDARVLGAVAPIGAADWIGANALGPLTLGTLRYVRSDAPARPVPGFAPAMPRGRIRHGLVVYDGGQA